MILTEEEGAEQKGKVNRQRGTLDLLARSVQAGGARLAFPGKGGAEF